MRYYIILIESGDVVDWSHDQTDAVTECQRLNNEAGFRKYRVDGKNEDREIEGY